MLILYLLPLAVTLGGSYLLFKLDFFFILHPKRTLLRLFPILRSPDSRRSLFLALAGTLGVGNIVGVAVGISVGGAGSVFWLLVSAIFASALKYSEATLATAVGRGRGMIDAIAASFGEKVSRIYALAALFLAFFMGCALQTASFVGSAVAVCGVSPSVAVAIFSVLALALLRLGADRVDRACAVIIPIATLLYVLLAMSAIILNLGALPRALGMIFYDAFKLDSALGGVIGFLTSTKLREGYARGLLSNEAGAGTSSFAHTRTSASASDAGVQGICEVLFDTVILCTLTALSILVMMPEGYSGESGVGLIVATVGSVFGIGSRYLILILIGAFALSTVICWYCYGSVAYGTLIGRSRILYPILFFLSLVFGSLLSERVLVGVSDTLLLILTLISTLTVIKNSDRIRYLSENGGLILGRNAK